MAGNETAEAQNPCANSKFGYHRKSEIPPPSVLGFPPLSILPETGREAKRNTEVTYIRNSPPIYLLFQKEFER